MEIQPDLEFDGVILDDWVIDHLKYPGGTAYSGDGWIQLRLSFDGSKSAYYRKCSTEL